MDAQLFSKSDPTSSLYDRQEENGLLGLLPAHERAVLEPHLERLSFRNGDIIACAGDPAESICFPLTGIAAVLDSPLLETYEVQPDDDVSWDGDVVNEFREPAPQLRNPFA